MKEAAKVVPFRRMEHEVYKGRKEQSSLPEIEALREALDLAREKLRSAQGSVELVRLGGLVAKLVDSIGKALLVEQKLSLGEDGVEWLRQEFVQVLVEMRQRRKIDEQKQLVTIDG